MAAQKCFSTNKEKDTFAANYCVSNRASDILSSDCFLNVYNNHQWLSRVYESVEATDGLKNWFSHSVH